MAWYAARSAMLPKPSHSQVFVLSDTTLYRLSDIRIRINTTLMSKAPSPKLTGKSMVDTGYCSP
jgi:hypothetical protein